ncbi:Oxygen regulatory protein NreC [Planctomycetes bacterium CA13]|uniref:Oxygen regulatory protein NreC n=1 Tax=Novipirellula herctigrandis TaxID=2527986 RepID=A0A5C5YXZ4_9BACT|nr:Oxygen regulatory protein NreC [Planctomycetes bacterium CA13]
MNQESKKSTRILIVDDHAMVREGLATFLSNQPGMQVCGEASGASEAMRQIEQNRPDFMIVDMSLKVGHGIELIKQVHALDPSIKMLGLSMHDECLYAERAIRAGAMGYLSKEHSRTLIIDAIRTILRGQVFLSDAMTSRLLKRSIGKEEDSIKEPIDTLSDREMQVFQLIGQGITVREIANKLELSPKTVETYRENIKAKLGLDNATELIRHAVLRFIEET